MSCGETCQTWMWYSGGKQCLRNCKENLGNWRNEVQYSATLCKLIDLIPNLYQSDCWIPRYASAKTMHSWRTNHGQTTTCSSHSPGKSHGHATKTNRHSMEVQSLFTIGKTAASLWRMIEEHSYFTIGKMVASLGRMVEKHSYFTIGRTAASLEKMIEEHSYFTLGKTAASLGRMVEEHSCFTISKTAASLGRMVEEHSCFTIGKTAASLEGWWKSISFSSLVRR